MVREGGGKGESVRRRVGAIDIHYYTTITFTCS